MEKRYSSAAIICEYNPFHHGHAYQIAAVKQKADVVVGIMSGAFVQRGGVAVADKYSRAAAALEGGMDLVLELPFPYSVSSAGDFAAAGVSIAAGIGAECLAFGCEDEYAVVSEIANALSDGTLKEAAEALIQKDRALSYPRAMQRAAEALFGQAAATAIARPNNILAAEYTAAIKRKGLPLAPLPVRRSDRYLSSTAIRENGDFNTLLPYPHYFAERRDLKHAERLLLHSLRSFEGKSFYGVDASLAARLKTAARNAKGLEELVSSACGKAYTAARIRRAVLAVWLGISTEAVKAPPVYTLLLAANGAGKAFLKSIKGSGSVAVITKPADYKKYKAAVAAFEKALSAEECAALCSPRILPYGTPLTAAPIIKS